MYKLIIILPLSNNTTLLIWNKILEKINYGQMKSCDWLWLSGMYNYIFSFWRIPVNQIKGKFYKLIDPNI